MSREVKINADRIPKTPQAWWLILQEDFKDLSHRYPVFTAQSAAFQTIQKAIQLGVALQGDKSDMGKGNDIEKLLESLPSEVPYVEAKYPQESRELCQIYLGHLSRYQHVDHEFNNTWTGKGKKLVVQGLVTGGLVKRTLPQVMEHINNDCIPALQSELNAPQLEAKAQPAAVATGQVTRSAAETKVYNYVCFKIISLQEARASLRSELSYLEKQIYQRKCEFDTQAEANQRHFYDTQITPLFIRTNEIKREIVALGKTIFQHEEILDEKNIQNRIVQITLDAVVSKIRGYEQLTQPAKSAVRNLLEQVLKSPTVLAHLLSVPGQKTQLVNLPDQRVIKSLAAQFSEAVYDKWTGGGKDIYIQNHGYATSAFSRLFKPAVTPLNVANITDSLNKEMELSPNAGVNFDF